MASATSVKPRPKSTSNKLVSPSSSNFSKEKKNKRETDATNRPDPAMEPISLFFQSILHRCFFFSTASAVESRDEPPSSEYPFLEEDFQSARFDVDFVGFWICFFLFFCPLRLGLWFGFRFTVVACSFPSVLFFLALKSSAVLALWYRLTKKIR